jgi:hypothetical protein
VPAIQGDREACAIAGLAPLDHFERDDRVLRDWWCARIRRYIDFWLFPNASPDEGENFVEAAQPESAVERQIAADLPCSNVDE